MEKFLDMKLIFKIKFFFVMPYKLAFSLDTCKDPCATYIAG